MRWLAGLVGVLVMLMGEARASEVESRVVEVVGGEYRLAGKQFTQRKDLSRPPPVLVLVLHGDAPRNHPDYQYLLASRLAELDERVLAVALLRPGYRDPDGFRSAGKRGQATGDNWNRRNTESIAQAVMALQNRYAPVSTIVVGHSGGALMAANILLTHPTLFDAAVLVSCPCDVNAWRRHMLQRTNFRGFRGDLPVSSPQQHVARLPADVPVVLVVGQQDKITPASLSDKFLATATAAGKPVTLVRLPQKGHEILLEPEVVQCVGRLLPSSAGPQR